MAPKQYIFKSKRRRGKIKKERMEKISDRRLDVFIVLIPLV